MCLCNLNFLTWDFDIPKGGEGVGDKCHAHPQKNSASWVSLPYNWELVAPTCSNKQTGSAAIRVPCIRMLSKPSTRVCGSDEASLRT